jgi:Cu/Ag efflux pump CusA
MQMDRCPTDRNSRENREISKLPAAAWNFCQPIEDNVGESSTGTKGQLALKVFGHLNVTLAQRLFPSR